jgi:hypothetical protein
LLVLLAILFNIEKFQKLELLLEKLLHSQFTQSKGQYLNFPTSVDVDALDHGIFSNYSHLALDWRL